MSWQQRIFKNLKREHPYYITAKRTDKGYLTVMLLEGHETSPTNHSQNTESSEWGLAQAIQLPELPERSKQSVYRCLWTMCSSFRTSPTARTLPLRIQSAKHQKDLMTLGKTCVVFPSKMSLSAATKCLLAYMLPIWFRKCYFLHIKYIT